MNHIHHIIPKHEWKKRYGSLKGVNNSSNVELLTTEEHATIHYERWVILGFPEDYIAWRALSGQIGREQAIIEAGRAASIGRIWSAKALQTNAEKHSKQWILTSPDGEVIHITNMFKFCRENNLQVQLLHRTAQGTRPHHKGWKAEYVTIGEI